MGEQWHRSLWVRVGLGLCVACIVGAITAGCPAGAQQADYSGLDPFWNVAEILAAGETPNEVDWAAMYETPGYGSLQARENADRFLARLLPLALHPERSAEADELIAAQPAMGIFIAHLRRAFERRGELTALQKELQERSLIGESLLSAGTWLPAGSIDRYGPPQISFVIYQPDARGYDRIVMDLLLAYERPDVFEGLVAHEAHHVIRNGIQGDWDGDAPEAELLIALNNLQAEGIADMIDKHALFAIDDWGDNSVDVALRMMTDRLKGEYTVAEQRLAEVDGLLAAYAADPTDAEQLGEQLRGALIMGGHPVGYYMATVINDNGGAERMVANVGNPFDFVRAYNDAAAAAGRYVLRTKAIRGLTMLEAVADRE